MDRMLRAINDVEHVLTKLKLDLRQCVTNKDYGKTKWGIGAYHILRIARKEAP